MKDTLFLKNKTRRIFFVLTASILLIGATGTCLAQIHIDHPPHDGITVGRSTVVAGSASIPPGHHLWVLFSPGSYGELWWPVGEARIYQQDNKWNLNVNLGGPEDRGEFRIAVIVVDQSEHRKLENYLRQTAGKADFGPQPIMMPRLSKPELTKIRKVMKR